VRNEIGPTGMSGYTRVKSARISIVPSIVNMTWHSETFPWHVHTCVREGQFSVIGPRGMQEGRDPESEGGSAKRRACCVALLFCRQHSLMQYSVSLTSVY